MVGGHPAYVPRVDYLDLSEKHDVFDVDAQHLLRYDAAADVELDDFEDETNTLKPPVKGMELVKLHVSGTKKARVNLMFLADGCKLLCEGEASD